MPRHVRVAAVTNWRSGRAANGRRMVPGNVERMLEVISLAATEQPDIFCLPEFFHAAGVEYGHAADVAEPVDGPTVVQVSDAARRFHAYIICPIYERRGDRIYNSAVLLDRSGAIAGIYEKRHPTHSEIERGVTPGTGPMPVFDTDFGRIGIQICFDINWPAGWSEVRQEGAEIIFWPSAYEGGWPLRTLAFDNQVFVVSSTGTPTSWVVDITGEVLASTGLRHDWIVETIDLEKRLFHVNFNDGKVDQIVERYGKRLRWDWFDAEGYFTLASLDDALPLKRVIDEFQLETMDAYIARMSALQERAAREQATLSH